LTPEARPPLFAQVRSDSLEVALEFVVGQPVVLPDGEVEEVREENLLLLPAGTVRERDACEGDENVRQIDGREGPPCLTVN
jgi:hypothetical protein